MSFNKDTGGRLSEGMRASLFFAALYAVLWMMFFLHHRAVYLPVYSLSSALLDSALDAMLFALPFFFAPRRLVWAVVPLLAILFEANVLYFRSFHYLPVLSSLNLSAFNTYALEGAAVALKPVDLLMTILPVAALAVVWFALGPGRICRARFSRWVKVAAIVGLFAVVGLRSAHGVWRLYKWRPDNSVFDREEFMSGVNDIYTLPTISTLERLYHCGFPFYVWRAVESVGRGSMKLTDDDVSEIQTLLASRRPGRVMTENRGKNLVLVIVESFNTSAVRPDVMPFLCARIDSGAFYVPELLSQVRDGRSSDGQLMYNTGMLPLEGEAFVNNYAEAAYPSLAKMLGGYESVEVIPESAAIWCHDITTHSYGYGRMVDRTAPDELDKDMQLMKRAAVEVANMVQPFFMEIPTIAMHDPYQSPKTTAQLPSLDSLSDVRARNYLLNAHHFDCALREFIGSLDSLGMLENTVVVIAGDHTALEGAMAPELITQSVPMVILNAGIFGRIDGLRGQIDLFPTILDIMGVESRYRGLGVSLLSDAPYQMAGADEWNAGARLIRSRRAAEICDIEKKQP